MQHSFDIEIAKEYGLLEAILLNNIQFWIEKNIANNKNFYDGEYWTYNSTRAFNQLFPYVSQRQIQNALKHLRDEDILQVGNYNSIGYDRTLWYAFTPKGKAIMQKCKMHYAKMLNGLCKNVKPIPNINTDINTNNNNVENDIPYDEIVDYLNHKTNSNFRSKSKNTRKSINARLNEGYTIDDFKKVIDNKTSEWLNNPQMEMYLRPETLFGTKFESYLNQKNSKCKEHKVGGIAPYV